ncbi:4'-phosphopantetheinyl transferase superfamily protein [Streptomyces sp. NPDC048411]|uniref:4'-phosphopantetheinyl transferase family protein n=1 Tax=Streptomyces sp. NPDC048411 TaxID=3157206 RepID=UPI00345571EA
MAPPYNMFENHSGRGAEDSPAAAFHALHSDRETNIWWWRHPLHTDPADLSLLNTEEFQRALSLRSEQDAAAYVHIRATTRRAVGELLGVAPEDVEINSPVCPACDDSRHGQTRIGRPAVPLTISLARTGGHTALAIGTGPAIGIGTEMLRPVRQDVLREPWLTADEALHLLAIPRGPDRDAHYYRCWTRKEAVLKAMGHGVRSIRLDQVESHPGISGTVLMRSPGDSASAYDGWIVRDLKLSDRVAAACAQPAGTVTAQGPVRLHLPGDTPPEEPPGPW